LRLALLVKKPTYSLENILALAHDRALKRHWLTRSLRLFLSKILDGMLLVSQNRDGIQTFVACIECPVKECFEPDMEQ